MRTVANKWKKFEVLKQHGGVAKHIPHMQPFSEAALRAMLDRYRFVVAKPYIGTGGGGVVKVEKIGEGRYLTHYRYTEKIFTGIPQLVRYIDGIRRGRQYMVQQGIDLARVGGRRTDYRVKIVKQPSGVWKITAVVARIAKPGLFVTNLCQGGHLMKGMQALRVCFPKKAKDKRLTMIGVARTCTKLLEQKYPGISQLGFDFGIDRQGTVWILEVNTRPH
jgi:glutathione synthase/RimK-type ligase-like ATP-grasp enzyme